MLATLVTVSKVLFFLCLSLLSLLLLLRTIQSAESANTKFNTKDQNCNLNLVVVMGSGPLLLGRDWLKHIRLDWYELN